MLFRLQLQGQRHRLRQAQGQGSCRYNDIIMRWFVDRARSVASGSAGGRRFSVFIFFAIVISFVAKAYLRVRFYALRLDYRHAGEDTLTHTSHAGHAVRSNCTRSAARLAPSAVTASAVGGSATRSVVADSLRRRAARRGARAIARRRGSKLGWLGMCWRVLGEWRETRAKMSAPF